MASQDLKPGRTYSVNELADQAGVTRRTIYYYVAQGLLPPAGTEGPGTRYGEGHLDRLRLIRELQREHLPLSEIRQRMERVSDGQVRDLLNVGDSIPEPRGTAFDYIQSVLAGTNRRSFGLPMSPRHVMTKAAAQPAPAAAGPSAPQPVGALAPASPPGVLGPIVSEAPTSGLGEPGAGTAGAGEWPATHAPPPEPSSPGRSQWERISIAPDVELHVRRPLGRIQNRAVDRLVGLARKLLEEDLS